MKLKKTAINKIIGRLLQIINRVKNGSVIQLCCNNVLMNPWKQQHSPADATFSISLGELKLKKIKDNVLCVCASVF